MAKNPEFEPIRDLCNQAERQEFDIEPDLVRELVGYTRMLIARVEITEDLLDRMAPS